MPESKTRWCRTCQKRHRLDHPHLKDEFDPELAVTGASTPAELGAQTEAEVEVTKARKPRKPKVDIEAEKIQAAIALNLGRRLAVFPYIGLAYLKDDARWRSELVERDIAELGEAWARVMAAWGIELSGKALSLMALALINFEVYTRLAQRLVREGEEKPKETVQ